MKKSQNYAFTCYPKEGDLEKFQALDCAHILLCEETCPTTGRLHWQSCIKWKNQRSWKESRGDLNWSEYKPCESRYENNVRYCLKGEQTKEEYEESYERGPNYGKNLKIIFEGGRRPMTSKEKGENEHQRCKRNLEALIDGRDEDVDIDIVAKQLQKYQHGAEFLKAARNKPVALEGIAADHFQWHSSELTGTGKTEYFKDLNPFVWTPETGWNKYDYQEYVVMTDIDEDDHPSMGQIKRWFDKEPFQARILYGTKFIRPKIIVTANDTLAQCYKNVKPRHFAALARRFRHFVWHHQYYLDGDEIRGIQNPDWCLPDGMTEEPGPYDHIHPYDGIPQENQSFSEEACV